MSNVLDNPEVRLREAAKQIDLAADVIDSSEGDSEQELTAMVARLHELANELEVIAAT